MSNKTIFSAIALLFLVVLSSPAFAMGGHPLEKASSSATTVANAAMRAPSKVNNVYSTNWAGYAVTGASGSVTDVKGSWIVPSATGKNAYSCNWVGIDGYASSTVEQIGTDSDTDNRGNGVYYAWYEFYPNPAYYVPFTVSPGDKINAEIRNDPVKKISTATITDVTKSKTVTVSKTGTFSCSSGEWITEAPWSNGVLPLANFGTTSYGNTYTKISGTCSATVNGQTNTIGNFTSNVNSITMINNKGATKASTLPLSTDGSSFQINWVRAS